MQNHDRRSILCPNCRRLVSVDEAKCPYCGMARPASLSWTRSLGGLFSDPERTVRVIIIANAVMFILSLLLHPSRAGLSMNPFGLLSPDHRSLVLLGETGAIPVGQLGRWWTLITANYLHGGILHILFNMMALRQIAPLIYHEYGFPRMSAIYTLGGVLGFYISVLAGIPFTLGASAAVCSLIGAALYYGKSRGGAYGEAVYRQLGGWVLGIFAFGFLMPGINNWGHGGGLLGGIILGFLLGYRERSPETIVHVVLGWLCVVGTAAALVWGTFSGLLLYFFVMGR
ncbi:MAG: rhomboid family intramembrane serine protease [Syntrophobacteraceae bacterium]|nr:rhomboid family intramembrane serine protease [Syntrophobacteraceae bacterium]